MAKVQLCIWFNDEPDAEGAQVEVEGERAYNRDGAVTIERNIGARLLGGPERREWISFPLGNILRFEVREL